MRCSLREPLARARAFAPSWPSVACASSAPSRWVRRIAGIDWGALLPHTPTEDRVAALVEVLLGVGLVAYGIARTRRSNARPPKPGAPWGLGLVSRAGAGIVFALAAVVDPTFVSLVVIAGRADLFWTVLAAHATWTLVSHTPLLLVLAFALSGANERLATWIQTRWERINPWIARLVTTVVLLVGLLLLLDATWFYLTGDLYLPS